MTVTLVVYTMLVWIFIQHTDSFIHSFIHSFIYPSIHSFSIVTSMIHCHWSAAVSYVNWTILEKLDMTLPYLLQWCCVTRVLGECCLYCLITDTNWSAVQCSSTPVSITSVITLLFCHVTMSCVLEMQSVELCIDITWCLSAMLQWYNDSVHSD